MIELTEWFGSHGLPDKPWLVLGKGPTFDRRGDHDLAAYNLLSLNHVVNVQPVDVAHVIDAEVVEHCAEALRRNCRWLLMPRRPHVRNLPGARSLAEVVRTTPVLRELDAEGKLVVYDAATAPSHERSPVVDVKFFSSEAALDILGLLGARTVRSLGIDGGRSYGGSFDPSTLLVNGEPSFDRQFLRLGEIARRHGMDYRPLVEPLRVFVGADRSQVVAAQVLEHTIREHASIPVQVVHMVDLPVPLPKDPANHPRTGFSFARFLIPELAGYRGRAVYFDADMQVFGDVAELAEVPFGDAVVVCTRSDEPPPAWRDDERFHPGRQFSVMVLDCERLGWRIDEIVRGLDEGRYTYADLLFDLCLVEPDRIDDSLPNTWNHLETYVPGETRLTHYTVGNTQPWRDVTNPLVDVWRDGYRDAVAAGAVRADDVRSLVASGSLDPYLETVLDRTPPPVADIGVLAAEVDGLRRELDATRARADRAIAELRWRRLPLHRKVRDKLAAGPIGPELKRQLRKRLGG